MEGCGFNSHGAPREGLVKGLLDLAHDGGSIVGRTKIAGRSTGSLGGVFSSMWSSNNYHMDGRDEQPGPAPGGSAGRFENLQGGVQGAPEREDGGPAVPDRRARLHGQRTSSHRYCGLNHELR